MGKLNLRVNKIKNYWESLSLGTRYCACFILGISCASLYFLTSCARIPYPEDNLVEEILEEVIQEKTGLQIDLSPGSPENSAHITSLFS